MKKFGKVCLGILYWIWQLTWGGLMTIPGLLITAFCIVFLKGKPHRNGFSYIVEIGGNWGGLELGAVALCGHYYINDFEWFEHTRRHEFGHSIQQLIFGPLQLFIVTIPSACRYWYAIFVPEYRDNDWYDSIWFENTATKWGTIWVDWIESENVDN
ncbi:MAG: hypothetical protein MJ237_09230 [bacterium]|nr:hypothetical protein [bacterium]